MANKYRLSSNTYDRETPNEQITPKKIFFISVEGVATEVEYLQGLSDYREELGIDSLVNVEVLRRKTKDGYSAPDQVVELLEEYLSLRETGDDIFSDIPYEIKNNFVEEQSGCPTAPIIARKAYQMYLANPQSTPQKSSPLSGLCGYESLKKAGVIENEAV